MAWKDDIKHPRTAFWKILLPYAGLVDSLIGIFTLSIYNSRLQLEAAKKLARARYDLDPKRRWKPRK